MLHLLRDPHRRHFLLTVVTGLGLLAYVVGSVRTVAGFDVAMLLALAGGYPTYLDSVNGLLRRKITADLAVSLAALAALFIGWRSADPATASSWFLVAAEVVFIMLVGESIEHWAIGHTRSGIAALLRLRPRTARVRRAGQELEVAIAAVRHDDTVLVRPGDRVPIDGRVCAGTSSIDQSPITGESLPADKAPGDEVFAGTINLYGALELAVERLGHDTTLERIIHLVEHAERSKAPAERLADRWASYFVPIVLVAAAVTFGVSRDVSRAVAVLVVACPCALVLATPTAIAAGIGFLVRRGILVKGGAVLESLGRLRAIAFDKTGTLSLARLRIERVIADAGLDEAAVIGVAAAVEQHSEHPIARLVLTRARELNLAWEAGSQFTAHPGLGAEALCGDQRVCVGNARYLESQRIELPDALRGEIEAAARAGATLVLVARGGVAIGAVAVADTLRPEARETVHQLRHLGIERVVMLTGDHAWAARAAGEALGISEVRSGLLPADKVEALRSIRAESAPLAMVGDGINDAPALAMADVGVALADIGSDVAIESADLVLVGDDLGKLPEAVECGRRTLATIRQNILAFAVVFNAFSVAAAALGWISPVTAAVLHQVGSLAVVLNSLRLLIDFHEWQHRLHHLRHDLEDHWLPIAVGAGALAVLAYVASGLHVIEIGQKGVVQRFGKRVLPLEEPGLHYRLPYPFASHLAVRPDDLRRVEIGFRSVPGTAVEPPAYEWNVQHRGGRYQRQPNEAAVWVGDENLVDVNLVVHYRLTDPEAAIFRLGVGQAVMAAKWDELVRALVEAGFHAEMARRPADDLLASARQEIADGVSRWTNEQLNRYAVGLRVERLCLGDIHPPVEVVPAFREVSSAMEEMDARLNEAEAYKYQTEALARGQAAEKRATAEGQAAERKLKADAGAKRFNAVAAAYQLAPEVTQLRLYLQMIEGAMAGRRKVIVDAHSGARRLIYLGRRGLEPTSPAVLEPPAENTEIRGNVTP